MVQTILRRDQVEQATGLCRSAIYQKISNGDFPRPIRLSRQSVGWLEAEIAEWQNARIAERDASFKREAA